MNGKAFLACVLMSVVLTGCETAKKNQPVIRNPDIQVGKLMDQSTEADRHAADRAGQQPDGGWRSRSGGCPVGLSERRLKIPCRRLRPVATTALPDLLGKNYIDHGTSTCCRIP